MICSSCGREIPDNSVFCTFCGASVQSAAPVAPAEQPVPAEPVVSSEQPVPVESAVAQEPAPVEPPVAEEPPVVPPAPQFQAVEQVTAAGVVAPAADNDLVAPYIPPQPDVPVAPDLAAGATGQSAYTPVQAPAPDPTQAGETTAAIPTQQQQGYGYVYAAPQPGGAPSQPGANPLPGGYAPQQGGYPPPQGGYAPQPGGYQQPSVPPTNYEQPKKKKTWVIVLVIVLVLLCCIGPSVTIGVMAANGFFSQSSYGGGTSLPPVTGNRSVTEAQLVGTWDEIDIDDTYVFNADGTGTETYEGDTWQMTWRLSGTTLIMNFPDTGTEEYEVEFDGGLLIVHTPIVDYEYRKR